MDVTHQRVTPKLLRRLNMLALIARWGHNVLLTGIALVTVAVLILAK